MIFQGIAPSISNDPEFTRFKIRLRMQYFITQFTVANNQLVKAFSAFGQSMRTAAESMRLMLPIFEKLNKEI